MARLNNPRRRLPLTPSLKLFREQSHIEPASGTNGPTSPPESPSASSEVIGMSSQTGAFFRFTQSLVQDPNIKPLGNGHQFSYQRTVLGLERLSPRSSSSSSSDAEEELDDKSSAAEMLRPRSIADPSMVDLSDNEGDGDEYDGENEMSSIDQVYGEDGGNEDLAEEKGDEENLDDGGHGDDAAAHPEVCAGPSLRLASDDSSSQSSSAAELDVDGVGYRSRLRVSASSSSNLVCNFVIEEMDPMDSDCEGLDILLPTEIESNSSRSRSRHGGIDRGMVRDFKNLNCSNETSEDEDGELQVFRRRQMEMRRIRRASMSSSFGKRTYSELSSDSDESDAGGMDVNAIGSSARRLRKRLHRGSLLFQDPPAPRIDELDEPDSSAEEYDAADPFARELPYFTIKIMEMDSA
ncbi:hypothetical protein E4U21_005931 [Claviceps maximensis]|nr:hypothetical protein E4U21_005931 [Claviceps maximensis]